MSKRGQEAIENNDTGESTPQAEKTAAGLSAGVWDDMRREPSAQAKDFKPAAPDGVEVIHPWSYLPTYKAEQEGRLQMDDLGKKFMRDDAGEKPPTVAIEAPSTLPSTVFTTRGADGSVESVSASFDKRKEQHDISMNADGTVKEITVTGADGKTHRVEGDISSTRNDDGSIGTIAFTDGNKLHVYGFDSETKEVSQVETHDGNRITRRTIAEGNEISSVEQVRDANKQVVEEYSRSADNYTAMKVHSDFTEQVTLDKSGKMTTTHTFNDGVRLLKVQAPNGDYSLTQTDADGNSLQRSLLRGNYTVEYRDSQGNWMREVTDTATNKTRSSRGDNKYNVIEYPESISM